MLMPIFGAASSKFIAGGGNPTPANWYVRVGGSDSNAGTSVGAAFLTIAKAISVSTAGDLIDVGAGNFVETVYLILPVGVSIRGAGVDVTYIKAHSSLYFSYAGSTWYLDKFLIQMTSVSMTAGNQTLSDFTMDGVSRQTRGAIYVNKRSDLIIENVKVINFQATGLWLNEVNNCILDNFYSSNSGWSSFGFALGGTMLGLIDGLEITNSYFNEDNGYGYGIKCFDFSNNNNIENLYFHDSEVTVHPSSVWNGGSAPNITFEVFQQDRKLSIEMYNVKFHNHISMVGDGTLTYTGTPSVHIHYCTFDISTRAGGSGYSFECQIGDVEFDHNYCWAGSLGIVQWGGHFANYWRIHHNTFYDLFSFYPTAAINIYAASSTGLANAKIYNNTHHISNLSIATYNSQKCEMNFMEFNNTADLTSGDIANNAIINTSGGTNCKFINLKSASNTIASTLVRYNFGQSLSGGVNQGLSGVTYTSNSTGTAGILASGLRPSPYYKPTTSGNLDQTGINVGLPFTGGAPSIGAWEI